MSVTKEAGTIFKQVGKDLFQIIFPPKEVKPSEYMHMHWCDKCGKYHKAE